MSKAKEFLSEPNDGLLLALASIGEAVIVVDVEGRITFLNPVAQILTGLGTDAVGSNLSEGFRIIDETTRQTVESAFSKVLRAGTAIGLSDHKLLVRKDGTEVPIDDSGAPIRDEAGLLHGVVLIFRDVTERWRATRALKFSEMRYRRLFEAVQDGILILDAKTGSIVDANPFMAELLGYELDALRGQELWQIGLFQDREASREAFRQLQERGQIRYEDLPLETRHGERREVEFVSNAYGVDGLQVVQCHIRDITERKRSKEALLDADRRKDEFLAMLAHELRNPLAPIRNTLHLLRLRGRDGPSEVQQAYELIERQVENMVRLVDDLLDVSRITRGKIQLQEERIDLATVVARAVEGSRPLIDARRHLLALNLPNEALFVEADPVRLTQVLWNLLNNAAKYTSEGGRIDLIVERGSGPPQSPPEAVIRIRDTGMGIPAEMLPKVFDLFTQMDRTLDRAEGGLGIGLTLVRSLTEMHGGTVEAFSAGLGRGSEFVLHFPALPAEPAGNRPMQPESATSLAAPTHGRRVLVVDDNRDAAESLAVLLRFLGNDVRTVYDGRLALEAAESSRPAVVLLDIGLPGLNGLEVCRGLRERMKEDPPLIVAMTGYGQEEDRRLSKEAGFNAHLVKPLDVEALQELLARSEPDGQAGERAVSAS